MPKKPKQRIYPSRHKLNWAERLTSPIRDPLEQGPPKGLWRFIFYFGKQTKLLIPAMVLLTAFEVLIDLALPFSLGWLLERLIQNEDESISLAVPTGILVGIALLFLFVRPFVLMCKGVVVELAMMTGFANLVRWQAHTHVLNHDMSYFNDEFSGRIATRVIETGRSVRSVILKSSVMVLYALLYLVGTATLLSLSSPTMLIPLALWACVNAIFLLKVTPIMRRRSKEHSKLSAKVTGRVVDSYSNIATVKLFANKGLEAQGAAEAIDDSNFGWARVMRAYFWMDNGIALANGMVIVATSVLGFKLVLDGNMSIGILVAILPMVYRLTEQVWSVIREMSWLYEEIGRIDDAQKTISHNSSVVDVPNAPDLKFKKGLIEFDRLGFNYGKVLSKAAAPNEALFDNLSFRVKPGEKIGLVGRSGSGKTSIINLMLRFFDAENGEIRIDGQNIAQVTQASLRRHIGVVTQDPGLLHRSIRENILYGRPDATHEEVIEAARKAEALDFILQAEDQGGRTGFDAQIGERGVKLSGGQRQRLAIARVILKDAPILVLDEATSALDSEVEAAIQSQLDDLLVGRTTIAIAHRLSTIAKMDRLIVLDQGKIIEEGAHETLLKLGGHYAHLWSLQSGGFIS